MFILYFMNEHKRANWFKFKLSKYSIYLIYDS